MKHSLWLLGVIVGVSAGLTAAQGPFRENLIADNGAELDVNLEETIPVDNTETTRISPLWLLAPELEAVGYAIGSRGTSGRFGSDFTIPFRGQAHFKKRSLWFKKRFRFGNGRFVFHAYE